MSGKNFLQKIKEPVPFTLLVIALSLLICAYNFRWKNDQWRYSVHTDAADYYRYLPTVFIEHHFNEDVANPIKYFTGTAVCYSPFFALACAGSLICGLPVDGYSMLFPILISIGTIVYLLFGLYFFAKFLRYYISKEWVICFILIVIAFGTTAYYYTVNAPGWAHIVAFGLLSFVLYHSKKLFVELNSKSILSVIAGVSFLFFVRPSDITILVLVPFLADNFSAFVSTLKAIFKERGAIIKGLLIAAIPAVCQFAIYKAYTGHFWVWSYTKEGFDFLHPEIVNELFSYAKGLFIYTPVCFLALFGLFHLYKINRYLFTGIVICILLNIYVISAWWCWNYGYSYGPRAFIEHYPLFFFPLAILLDRSKKVISALFVILIALCTALNLFQTYQTLCGILDQDFKTDQQGYWDVFLKLDKGYSGKFYRYPVDESKENVIGRLVFYNDMEKRDTSWLNPNSQLPGPAHSGAMASKVNKGYQFSTGMRKSLKDIPYHKNVFIRVSAWFYVPEKGSGSYFAFCFAAQGKAVNYSPFGLDGYTQHFGQWEYHVFELYMPKLAEKVEKDPTSFVEFYYFNSSDIDCYVDDLQIEFIEFKRMDRVLDLSWE